MTKFTVQQHDMGSENLAVRLQNRRRVHSFGKRLHGEGHIERRFGYEYSGFGH